LSTRSLRADEAGFNRKSCREYDGHRCTRQECPVTLIPGVVFCNGVSGAFCGHRVSADNPIRCSSRAHRSDSCGRMRYSAAIGSCSKPRGLRARRPHRDERGRQGCSQAPASATEAWSAPKPFHHRPAARQTNASATIRKTVSMPLVVYVRTNRADLLRLIEVSSNSGGGCSQPFPPPIRPRN
jgi:hypothetical protein